MDYKEFAKNKLQELRNQLWVIQDHNKLYPGIPASTCGYILSGPHFENITEATDLDKPDALYNKKYLQPYAGLDLTKNKIIDEIIFYRAFLGELPEVEVRESKTGRGVFAKEKISKREAILHITGSIYSPNVKESVSDPFTGNCHPLKDMDNPFLLEIAKKVYQLPDEPGRYLNHSCEPNCWIDIDLCCDPPATLVSLREIQADEELTFDYSTTSTDDHESWKMDCLCGVLNCRKVISGFNLLPNSDKINYYNQAIVPYYVYKNNEYDYKLFWVEDLCFGMKLNKMIEDEFIELFRTNSIINDKIYKLGNKVNNNFVDETYREEDETYEDRKEIFDSFVTELKAELKKYNE